MILFNLKLNCFFAVSLLYNNSKNNNDEKTYFIF